MSLSRGEVVEVFIHLSRKNNMGIDDCQLGTALDEIIVIWALNFFSLFHRLSILSLKS